MVPIKRFCSFTRACSIAAVLLVVLLLAPSVALAAGTWALYQNDTRHSGQGEYKGPNKPSVLWVVPFGGTGKPSTPIAVSKDGNVYVGVHVSPAEESSTTTTTNATTGGEHSGVFAFTKDSKVAWVSELKGIVAGPLAVGKDGTVYAVVGTTLAALNKKDGSPIWKLPLNSESPGGVMIANDGTIYATTLEGKTLYAVGSDGELKWTYVAGAPIHSSPAIGKDGTVYFTAQDKNLYAVGADGKLKWKFAVTENGNITVSMPALAEDDTVYFGVTRDGGYYTAEDELKVENGSLYAVSPDGKLKWTYKAQTKKVDMPAVNKEGTILVGGTSINRTVERDLTMGTVRLHAVSPDGKEKWVFKVDDDDIAGAPVIDVDGTIFVSSPEGRMTSITKGGVMKWRAKTGGKVSIGPGHIMYVAAKGSIAAMIDRDLKQEQKRTEALQREASDKSSGGSFSFMIYVIPVIVAAAIGYFFKTKLGSQSDSSDTGGSDT